MKCQWLLLSVIKKTTVLLPKKHSCLPVASPIYFICYQFLLCYVAYHNNFYWYRYRYLVFESIIYLFNYHADNNSDESSNKICNVGGTNSFKCFNKSLKNKNDNMKCAYVHLKDVKILMGRSRRMGFWRRLSYFLVQAWRSMTRMYCQGATESVHGFNSEFNWESPTARIVHIGDFCFLIFRKLKLSKKR